MTDHHPTPAQFRLLQALADGRIQVVRAYSWVIERDPDGSTLRRHSWMTIAACIREQWIAHDGREYVLTANGLAIKDSDIPF